MIKLRSPLIIEARPEGGCYLTFWADAFDFGTPFRKILAEITEVLGQDPLQDLHLPKQEEGEDFVEGTMRYGNASLHVYYEFCLGYLTLGSDNEGLLRDVATRVQSRILTV